MFDEWLICNSGAKLIENCLYISHIENNDAIIVKTQIDDKDMFFKCKYLIGADGGNSIVRKNIDQSYIGKGFIFCKQIIISGNSDIDPNYYYFNFCKDYTDFISNFSIKENLIYISTSFFLENKNNNYFKALYDYLENKFNFSLISKIREETCISYIGYHENCINFGKKNVLLIGEASRLVTNMGEGISSALLSGKYSAESIIESFKNNNSPLEIYNEKMKEQRKYIERTWE